MHMRGRLRKCYRAGLIDEPEQDMANRIRNDGNDNVHENPRAAADVLRAIHETLYVIRRLNQ